MNHVLAKVAWTCGTCGYYLFLRSFPSFCSLEPSADRKVQGNGDKLLRRLIHFNRLSCTLIAEIYTKSRSFFLREGSPSFSFVVPFTCRQTPTTPSGEECLAQDSGVVQGLPSILSAVCSRSDLCWRPVSHLPFTGWNSSSSRWSTRSPFPFRLFV